MRAAGLAMLAAAGALVAGAGVAVRAQDAPGGVSAVAVANEGKDVYEQICQACHMADAKGGDGAGAVIPALAGNPRLADPQYAVLLVTKGRGGMPGFTDLLTPAQLAASVNYVRTHFNSYPETVSAADIEKAITSPLSAPDCNCTQ